jgi:CelD/BcsL family acetyltransferase involved in cellulose biosynthesis
VSLDIEWIEEPRRFDELAAEWDALLPADALPFDLHCWYSAWWKSFGAGAELAVCTVRRGGELAGAFPLLDGGGRLRSLANAHTPAFRPLARDGDAMRSLIAATLERSSSGIELIALPEGDASIEALRDGAHEVAMLPLIEASYASPFVETEGDFDAWRAENKRRWGAPLERLRRKMNREHDAEFLIVVTPADLEAELEDGIRVEGSGWKGRAGTAIDSDPATEAFYRAVAGSFQARGELRFSRIVLDGRTVAFDLCILRHGRLYLLKTGFDEDFRRLAPGLVMRLSIIEHCFEHGLRSHELLGVETDWKAKFATSSRPRVSLRTYRRNPAGRAGYAYRTALRPRLRRVYRRLRRSG